MPQTELEICTEEIRYLAISFGIHREFLDEFIKIAHCAELKVVAAA